ncbi:hypothetical protein T12_2806 [Trichinella patagoniensis]|uniref:Uncharacterized protein n=1 Tax=Trichinella patagoniensis TaxID=990121 RepID=A0A0V0YZN6_9BILA|nr:hypothetical protein T12_2806 [Trichinella patagoniensis]
MSSNIEAISHPRVKFEELRLWRLIVCEPPRVDRSSTYLDRNLN